MLAYYKRIFDFAYLKKQKVFFYGLSALSLSAIDCLRSQGVPIAGLCDDTIRKGGDVLGDIPLLPLSSLCSEAGNDSVVIYGCTNQHGIHDFQRYIRGSVPDCKIMVLDNISEVYIDVSGRCNLRCRSCQVCNHAPGSFHDSGRSEMGIDLFRQVLRKVKAELPDNPAIFLFDFGEPLLSSHLPEVVEAVHAHDMAAVISSNLSLEYDFEPLLKKHPDVLKISVSGFYQDVYGTTHNGGNIELVKRNMRELREMIDRYKLSNIRVIVGYHVYKNNAFEDYERMKAFCRELGFLFQPRRASFCNIPKQSGIDPYSDSDRAFIQTYYENSGDILNTAPLAQPQAGVCNIAKNKLFIDYNADVLLCYLVMHREAVFRSYLETSLADIHHWQKTHWICERCKRIGLASLS